VRRARRTPGVLVVLAIGTGVVALSAIGIAAPAQASPYPSWSDVQAAKGNQAKAEKEISTLGAAISSLQSKAQSASDAASGAGERYQIAVNAEQAAASQLAQLKSQQSAAAATAKASRQRVGQLVAQLSHSGGQQLTVTMLTDSSHAGDLLYQLGAMTNLTARTTGLLDQATADANEATALQAQAQAAQTALARRSAAAKDALAAANRAADTASTALAAQTKNQSQLIAQVAYLKGTTAAVETKYYDGLAAGTIADAIPAPATTAHSGSGGSSHGGGSSAGSGSAGSGSSGGSGSAGAGSGSAGGSGTTTPSKPAPPAPSKPAAPTPPKTTPPPVTTPPPSSGTSSQVATAIAYAKAQLGKAYVFGAAGPNAFDCSGLMMASYSAAGVYIGGHSVRWQWDYLTGEGHTAALSQARPGDILFYHNGTDGYYHDAMYIGGGMMLEAPNPSATVRIVAVRYTELLTTVGRPVS
jgi:cell wall-associated NlpC family hydrolase